MSAHPDVAVAACPACQSPVFEDERYCEACGRQLVPDPVVVEAAEDSSATALPPEAQQRIEVDEGFVATVSDRGWRRRRNEDAVEAMAVGDRAAVAVCDGVASTASSHRAAQAAARAVLNVLGAALLDMKWPSRPELHAALRTAFAEAQRSAAAMEGEGRDTSDLAPSTTLVAAVAVPGYVVVGNVGDSRAYWLGRDDHRLLTVDDTKAQDQIARGVPEAAAYADPEAHQITRWIGADAESTEPRITEHEVTEPGLLLVCTDGLWNYFETPEELAELTAGAGDDHPLDIARRLTEAALDAGGQDNITVAVVPVGPAAPTTSVEV
ncbi:MAG TPA: protein phosphatase 2C domain-containing protein [Acidimicrobiales bacterium]|nr:protein phosphatase 2C domain-containing protein [Acidimicrobiales bacterium]